jgi:hypothetical protein
LLRYEASRQPALANLCEKVGILEDSDIDYLPYLPWIRSALKLLAAQQRSAKVTATVSEAVAANVVDGLTPDLSGVVYEYTGDTIFVKDSGNGSELQVPTGKLFLVMDQPEFSAVEVKQRGMSNPAQPHTLWVETVSCVLDRRLLGNCVRVQAATKQEYRILIQQRLQRYHPNAPQTVCLGAESINSSQPLAHLRVQIQR